MAGVTWPSISSALDTTVAALDALHTESLLRREESRARLEALVAHLGESSAPWTDEAPLAPVATRARSDAREGMPYIPLPERTTHGGDFGPAVRRKLIAEALARR